MFLIINVCIFGGEGGGGYRKWVAILKAKKEEEKTMISSVYHCQWQTEFMQWLSTLWSKMLYMSAHNADQQWIKCHAFYKKMLMFSRNQQFLLN